MAKSWKAALVAASLACASSAHAAFVTYTFNLAGSGIRMTEDLFGNLTSIRLKSAHITIGLNTFNDDGIGFGSDYASIFNINRAGSNYEFAFSPAEFQSSLYANGQGSSCLGCTGYYDLQSPRGGYSETFDGAVSSFTVQRVDSGTDFLSIVSYVPEPSTWALMLAGFGMVGYALRRRPRLSYAT